MTAGFWLGRKIILLEECMVHSLPEDSKSIRIKVQERRPFAGQRLSPAFPYRFGVWFNKFPY